MFVAKHKQHNEETKKKISDRLSKHPYGVGIYDLKDNLIKNFKNNVQLAEHLNISKVTVVAIRSMAPCGAQASNI